MKNWPVFRHVYKPNPKRQLGAQRILTIPWRTSIPMFLYIEEPRDARHSRDKTLPWVDTLKLPARNMPEKQEKQETKKFDKKQTSQPPFLFSQNCLKICETSKENLNLDQSECQNLGTSR
jgi:hypothetical protein